MQTVKLLSKYPRVDLKADEVTFDAEKEWSDRPAWIRVNNLAELPRFISIQVPKFGELIYKSFGKYYYPFDYTNDEERRFMDGMAQDYDTMVADTFNVPMARVLLEKTPLSEIPTDYAILDLGCGTGIISDILSQQGYKNLTLVDFSQGMLDTAKAKPALSQANFVQADITTTLPQGEYGLVVSVMLFNTFDAEQTEKVFSLLLPRLKPGAILAVLEDTQKPSYAKHFDTLFSGMVDVANRTKFIFVGRLKS
jgi:ubiquinone/menaquinone biosynthesis C-methylase UbiE